MRAEERVYTGEFKLAAVQRILTGANVCGLSRELGVRRSVLYRWRDAYRREGAAGLQRGRGRPPENPKTENRGQEHKGGFLSGACCGPNHNI